MSQRNEETDNGVFLRKVNGYIKDRRYYAVCPCCEKEHSVRIWFNCKKRALRKLSRTFNTCHQCGRYVCDDCYVITSHSQSIRGVCRICAEALGIAGRTTTEIVNGIRAPVPCKTERSQSS